MIYSRPFKIKNAYFLKPNALCAKCSQKSPTKKQQQKQFLKYSHTTVLSLLPITQ